jgi:hypothetical protein
MKGVPTSKKRIKASYVIAAAAIAGCVWIWLTYDKGPRLSLLCGLFPVESSTPTSTSGAAFETINVFVVEADFFEFVARAHEELVTGAGWNRANYNFDGKAGGGPFVDFIGPTRSYRIIRGDRTFPASMRAKVSASDRHKFVVISASEEPNFSTRFGEWWRKLTQ